MRQRVPAIILSLSVGLVTAAVPATRGPVPGTDVSGASCAEELARQDAALRQFDADARKEGLNFALDDARRTALDAVKKGLAGDPTADALKEMKARWDEYQEYVRQHDVYQEVLQEIRRCLTSGAAGCMATLKANLEPQRLLGRFGEAFQQWVDSLGNEAISKAVERVDRARNIMQNFTQRAAGMSMDAASRGIDSCLRNFDQRVQQAQNTSTPVDVQPPPPPGAAATAVKKGPGKLLPLALGLGGAAGGAWYLGKTLGGLDTAGNGGSSGGGQPTITNKHEPWVCSGNRCTGRLTIDFPGVMNSGTITAGTDSLFLGQISVDPTRPPGSKTIDMVKSPYVTCYGTQTNVLIWNSAFTNAGPAAYVLPTSIRVECR